MTEHACRQCKHWHAPERETEDEMTIGTCKAWPPVASHESCGVWSERLQ